MFQKLFGKKQNSDKIREIHSDDEKDDKKGDDKKQKTTPITKTEVPIENNPCLNKHLRSAELFCKGCRVTVCSKCINCHKNHQVTDYEEILDEITKESKHLSSKLWQAMELKQKEKEVNSQLFEEKVQTHYDNQVNTISNYFRELHDTLHIREVELKRELKSYHDDNSETFTTLVSKIDHDVERSNHFLREIDTLKAQPTEEQQKISKEVKNLQDEKNLKLIKDYYETLEIVTSKTTIPNEFNIYNFIETPNTPKLATCLRLVKKRFQSPFSSKKSNSDENTIVYVFSKEGVEVLDTRSYSKTMVLGSDAPHAPPLLSFFWQYSVVNGVIYMFDREKYWVVDTKADNPAWREGAFPINKSSSVSTIYDGKESIYIFSGYPNGQEDLKDIYRFNIKEEKFQKVAEKLVTSSYLTISIHDDKIHLIGGYNTVNSWLNRIDTFDLKTLKSENLVVVADTSILINSGVYVPTINTYFLFTWTSNFHKYEPETGIYTKLAKPNVSANYCKLFFDGDNTILLFVEHDKNIHQYDIKNNTFTTIPHGLSCEIDSSSFFAMASD